MNMYQLEKLHLLYDVCFDLFDSKNYDYHAIDIKEVSNDFCITTKKSYIEKFYEQN